METINNLGGSMPQERLDSIKFAWMARNNKTEQEWINFTPTVKLKSDSIRLVTANPDFDSFDEEAAKMEFIFCPDWREMGFRYQTKVRYFERLSDQAFQSGNPVLGADYYKEVVLWSRFMLNAFAKANEIRRKF